MRLIVATIQGSGTFDKAPDLGRAMLILEGFLNLFPESYTSQISHLRMDMNDAVYMMINGFDAW